MTLVDQLELLATRIGVEAKSLRTLLNGNDVDLDELLTLNKTSLVAAINELASLIVGSETLPVTSGLVARYDATTLLLTNGSNVDTWPNLVSGKPNAIGTGSEPTYETSSINGLPSVKFAGNSDSMKITGLNVGGNITVLVATQAYGNPVNAASCLICSDNGGQSFEVRFQDITSPFTHRLRVGNSNLVTYPKTMLDSGYVVGFINSSQGIVVAQKQGVIEFGTLVDPSTMAGTDIYIGSNSSQNRGIYANIGEVLIYDRALTSGEYSKVEAFLGRRWGAA